MPTDSAFPRLPARPADGHKGTFGTVAVVGGSSAGSTRMIGAPALTATAAARAGAGLVRVVAPEPIVAAVLGLVPTATGLAMPVDPSGSLIPHEATACVDEAVSACDCLAIGPGLGHGAGAKAAALRAVQQDTVSVVVDADAISALAEIPELLRDVRAAAVWTPHPGEFKRLCAAFGQRDNLGLDRSREAAAEAMAQRLGGVVVLKGQGTVVSDGVRTWTNTTGHPCLATGGTGDVLTGLIAALIAQYSPKPQDLQMAALLRGKLPPPPGRPLDLFEAARLAVHAHGLAAERWAAASGASAGMLAMELAHLLPPVLESLRERV